MGVKTCEPGRSPMLIPRSLKRGSSSKSVSKRPTYSKVPPSVSDENPRSFTAAVCTWEQIFLLVLKCPFRKISMCHKCLLSERTGWLRLDPRWYLGTRKKTEAEASVSSQGAPPEWQAQDELHLWCDEGQSTEQLGLLWHWRAPGVPTPGPLAGVRAGDGPWTATWLQTPMYMGQHSHEVLRWELYVYLVSREGKHLCEMNFQRKRSLDRPWRVSRTSRQEKGMEWLQEAQEHEQGGRGSGQGARLACGDDCAGPPGKGALGQGAANSQLIFPRTWSPRASSVRPSPEWPSSFSLLSSNQCIPPNSMNKIK